MSKKRLDKETEQYWGSIGAWVYFAEDLGVDGFIKEFEKRLTDFIPPNRKIRNYINDNYKLEIQLIYLNRTDNIVWELAVLFGKLQQTILLNIYQERGLI